MVNILNWVLHGVVGCPKRDKYQVMYGSTHCHGCGRVNFLGDSFPKFPRFTNPRPRLKLKNMI